MPPRSLLLSGSRALAAPGNCPGPPSMTPGLERTKHARWPLLIGLLGLPALGLISALALGRDAQDEALAALGKLGAAGLRIWLLRTGAGARTHRAAAVWYAESLLDLVSLSGLGCLGLAILWPVPGLVAAL